MDKNRVQGVSVGRAGNLPRSPYPSKMRSVDPAAAHGRRLSLPQEICSASVNGLRLSKGGLTARQKSAEGIVGHDVGKAFEELTRSPLRMNRYGGGFPAGMSSYPSCLACRLSLVSMYLRRLISLVAQ